MKNLNIRLTMLLLLVSTLTVGQATFDPAANKKKVAERRALEKAERDEIEAKNAANKARLLANLPQPSYVKEINDDYHNNFNMYEPNSSINNHEVLINKKALQNIDDKLDKYLDNFANEYQNSFITISDKNEQIELAKKHYIGAMILKNIDDSIAVDYVKFIDIPETDRFVRVAYKYIQPDYYLKVYESTYSGGANLLIDENPSIISINTGKIKHYHNDEKYYAYGGSKKNILQNTKTKLYYVINENTIYDNVYYDGSSKSEELFVNVPPTAQEIAVETARLNQLVAKYKSLIKSAYINCVVLQEIQKKYLTRGYFDADRVKGIDKQNYNKNLAALKVKADKMTEIYRHEDKDDKAQMQLTMEELGSLSAINKWNLNVFPIN